MNCSYVVSLFYVLCDSMRLFVMSRLATTDSDVNERCTFWVCFVRMGWLFNHMNQKDKYYC